MILYMHTQSFHWQAKHGEQAGALGVLIVNDSNDFFIMTDDGSGRTVKTHTFLISQIEGTRIKSELPCSQNVQPCSDTSRGVWVSFGLGFMNRVHSDML